MSALPQNQFPGPKSYSRQNPLADVKYLPVAADQTIKAGDLLVLTSGALAQAIALPGTNDTGADSASALGEIFVAMADITTGATVGYDTLLPVQDLREISITLSFRAATPGASERRDVNVGTRYKLGRWRGKSASEWNYYVSPTTTNADVTVVNVLPDSNDATTTYPIVEVTK